MDEDKYIMRSDLDKSKVYVSLETYTDSRQDNAQHNRKVTPLRILDVGAKKKTKIPKKR